ncbi:signal peptidase I [Geoglobus sp.]
MIIVEQLALLGVLLVAFGLYLFRDEILLRERASISRAMADRILRKMFENRTRKIVTAVFEILLILSVLYLVLTMKLFWAVVVSNSMYPTFERGDMVLVQSLFVSPERGDIVMFRSGELNLPVTHRVLDVRGDLVYTGGDSSGPDSTPVSRSAILGEVVTVFGKPIVIKGFGNYFILDATQMRDITPYGQEYLFYKNLLELIRKYALVISVISLVYYAYIAFRGIRI